MVFHSSLSDRKSIQVSRTLHSILADLNNAEVCMVSTRLLISVPIQFLYQSVQYTLTTVGITVIFMLHSFFSSRAWSTYLSLFSLSFILLWSQPEWQSSLFSRSLFFFFCFFFFCWLSLDLVVWPRLGDLFVSQSLREVLRLLFPLRILCYSNTICLYDQI